MQGPRGILLTVLLSFGLVGCRSVSVEPGDLSWDGSELPRSPDSEAADDREARQDSVDENDLDTGGENVLVFAYFKADGLGPGDGLHLARSEDGYEFKPVGGDRLFFAAPLDMGFRDPHVMSGPDRMFRMVWTAAERSIGYAESEDLVHWSAPRLIPVMDDEPTARNCWAPETWYDATRKEYLILWATTIPGRFPGTDASGDDGFNHRMYATTTTDFQTFTPTRLFYDPGFEVIDATLVQDGERLLMFVKNETLRPDVAKYVYLTTAPSPDGPWSPPGPPITEAFREGPSVARVGGRWFLYCDFYALGLYELYTSPDLQSWTDESESLRMPEGVRHGTALWIPRTVVDALDALVPAVP